MEIQIRTLHRLTHLDDQIGLPPCGASIANTGSRILVSLIGEAGGNAGPRFHLHLKALLDEALDIFGRSGHSAFTGPRFFHNTDLHDRSFQGGFLPMDP